MDSVIGSPDPLLLALHEISFVVPPEREPGSRLTSCLGKFRSLFGQLKLREMRCSLCLSLKYTGEGGGEWKRTERERERREERERNKSRNVRQETWKREWMERKSQGKRSLSLHQSEKDQSCDDEAKERRKEERVDPPISD